MYVHIRPNRSLHNIDLKIGCQWQHQVQEYDNTKIYKTRCPVQTVALCNLKPYEGRLSNYWFLRVRLPFGATTGVVLRVMADEDVDEVEELEGSLSKTFKLSSSKSIAFIRF